MAGVAECLMLCMLDGCLSVSDEDIERRPYHRNCNCPLHKSKGKGDKVLKRSKSNMSFPIKRSWSQGSLALAASRSVSSPSSSPILLSGLQKVLISVCKVE